MRHLGKPNPDQDIVADHLQASQAIYFAWQLDQMRAFQVVDRLAELFSQGLLPIGPGPARHLLSTSTLSGRRLSPSDRRSLYARALGVPGGTAEGPQPNREFLSLWLHFISGVALFNASHGSPQDGARRRAALVTAWRAAQALARNASAHGTGLSGVVPLLAADANALRDILRAPDVLRAFGARDMWQLIEAVSRNELGGAANVRRYRSLAESGSSIFAWLARHVRILNDVPLRAATQALIDPILVEAARTWAAASSSDDAQVIPAAEPASPGAGPAGQGLPGLTQELLQALGLGQPSRLPVAGAAQGPDDQSEGRVAVFRGAPRTGKTLAAHAVAAALSRELVRVDLHGLVGKYIGETEKNLAAVLNRVDPNHAVLLLDDADELFGTRGVQTAGSDETPGALAALLLPRLVTHGGLVIIEHSATADEPDADKAWDAVRVIRFPRAA